MAGYRPITKKEWDEYEWISVGGREFIRGIKKALPPDDGFVYVEVTTFSDSEQKWAQAVTRIDEQP